MTRIPAKRGLPLVRVSLLQPFVLELELRGLDADSVLAPNGLVRDTLFEDDVFVPPIVVHRFLEEAAQAARDPHLCARVGETLDFASWPPLIDAATHAATLGEFIVRFMRAAAGEASSARHALEISAEFALFRERRTSEQVIDPAQNDAFTVAYTLRFLRQAAGGIWNAGEVWVTVCDPGALPDRYMGVHVARGDRMGMTLRFPSLWLLQPFDRRGFLGPSQDMAVRPEVPTQFVEALRQVLLPHLHAEDLGVDYVARLLGTSPQSLQRKLRANKTTLSAEIRGLKTRQAIAELVQTDRPISEIAASTGYRTPTSFTRAFREWTGESPREYRKRRRAF